MTGAGAAWDEAHHPRIPKGEPGGGEFAPLGGSAVGADPGEIATANMTSAKADKSIYKQPSVASMMGEGEKNPKNTKLYEENLAHDVALFKNAEFYPNFRARELTGTVKEQADAILKNMASNLMFLYQHTTDAIRNAGLQWYDGAHKVATDLSGQYKLPLEAVVGCMAKLSPNKDWNQNVELARRMVDIYSTKQEYKFDKAMEEQSPKTWTVKSLGSGKLDTNSQAYKDKEALYKSYRDGIAGKTLGELTDPILKAVWIRTYDEAHSPQNYHMFLPNGDVGELARNLPTKAGEPGATSKLVWQSTSLLADAVKALQSGGNRDTLSDLMGNGHKVRSFFNNILSPSSPNRDTTIDTHAVGAALLRALGSSSVPVTHNFGLTPEKKDQPKNWQAASGSAITGLSGTYGFYADANRLAAKQLGINPAQLQAVTWEAKRDTLGVTSDKADTAIEATWHDYHDEKISQTEAQERVW